MTLAARDGDSARDCGTVMMRHGFSLVSVGAVRPPDAPAEPPSVAAGDLQGCAYLQASVRTLPGHARPGRRHIFSPAGYSHGQRPTGVNAPFASLHRLSVQQPRVIVSAQGNLSLFKERDLLADTSDTAERQPGGGLWKQAITPAGHLVGRVDAASTCVGEKTPVWAGPESPAHVAASTLPTRSKLPMGSVVAGSCSSAPREQAGTAASANRGTRTPGTRRAENGVTARRDGHLRSA